MTLNGRVHRLETSVTNAPCMEPHFRMRVSDVGEAEIESAPHAMAQAEHCPRCGSRLAVFHAVIETIPDRVWGEGEVPS